MKTTILKTLFFAGFLMMTGVLFAQSPNLRGKATAAAKDCINSFDLNGYGLMTQSYVEQVGTCPDGSPKWAVTIFKVGHCPGNGDILCLVIMAPIATVTFDCNENVQSIVCFN